MGGCSPEKNKGPYRQIVNRTLLFPMKKENKIKSKIKILKAQKKTKTQANCHTTDKN